MLVELQRQLFVEARLIKCQSGNCEIKMAAKSERTPVELVRNSPCPKYESARFNDSVIKKSRLENPHKLIQLSSRSYPRHLVGNRNSIKKDMTSDRQVKSNFPYRWSPASLNDVIGNVMHSSMSVNI